MSYPFIAKPRHAYTITTMCRVLEVSVSGYYAWCKRPPSEHSREDAHLAEQVKTAFQAHRGVYGSPRVHAELQAQGIRFLSLQEASICIVTQPQAKCSGQCLRQDEGEQVRVC
jgi:HTH-like domain